MSAPKLKLGLAPQNYFSCAGAGLILIDYLPPKKTITGQYYAELTSKLLDAIKQKCHKKLPLGV